MVPSAGRTWGLVTVLQRPGGVPARLMGLGQPGRVPCCWMAGATSTFWARGPGWGRSAWQGGTGPECRREPSRWGALPARLLPWGPLPWPHTRRQLAPSVMEADPGLTDPVS